MIATISGKRWRVIRKRQAHAWGTCDRPTTPDKAIVIDPHIRGEKLLEVILHESLHAAGWHIDEEFIAEYARDAARLATRMGFVQGGAN